MKPITHQPCPACSSSDALTIYEDGHSYCFSCGVRTNGEAPAEDKMKYKKETLIERPAKKMELNEMFPDAKQEFVNIKSRGLFADTCEKFDYRVSSDGKKHIATYRDAAGEVVGQKIRAVDPKGFSIKGNVQDYLYGMHLWGSGNKIVVTEGEIDTLSYSQSVDNRWPVVSVPNGAQSAKRAVLKNLGYLCQFGEVIFLFDSDEAGRKAAKECAAMIPNGKGLIASLPLKDANEMLLAGRTQELSKVAWNAVRFTPDGIVTVDDIMEDLMAPQKKGLAWAWPGVNALTRGRFPGSALGIGAATGAGKTDLLTQQMAYDLVVLEQNIGVFSFEQNPAETVKRIASKVARKRLYLPERCEKEDTEELLSYVNTFKDRLFLFDSFGSADWQTIENNIKYLFEVFNCQIFYIDNLTFLAESGNEKDSLETVMKGIATLANDLQIVIIFVSHLTTPFGGASHEEGARVRGRDFKGSRTIEQLAFGLYGCERNQQAEAEYERNTITFRVLKDRLTADGVGQCVRLYYNREEGMLEEAVDALPFSVVE